MKPIEKQIAIAEACGWKGVHLRNKKGARSATGETPWGIGPNGEWAIIKGQDTKYSPLPDYLNDLNAMHDAEKVLFPARAESYFRNLRLVITKGEYIGVMEGFNGYHLAHAPAAQRAEAFIRVIGKSE